MSNQQVPAAAEGMPDAQPASPPMDWSALYARYANLTNVIAMVHWQFLDNMTAVDDPAGSYYRMETLDADRGLSLLYMIEKFATDTLGEINP